MKKTLLLTLILSSTLYGQIEKKVCFLGNSYTYANDLPGQIAGIAAADGNTLIKDQNTPGGYTFEGHSTNTTSLTKIAGNTWDYVVLQEQSQLPSFPYDQVNTEILPFLEILVDSIRAANECAIPLFYDTWGRRDGDAMWDSINTFEKMNQRLYNSYERFADLHSGKISPVGIGFEHIKNDVDSPIGFTDLYVGDGSHPTPHGTYLAACLFYEVIFDLSAEGNTYLPDGLSESQAMYLQSVASWVLHEVDSIELDFTEPTAAFEITYDGLTASFDNQSEHAFTYLWDFGDGATSTEENPIHIFPDDAEYTITLTAIYCDRENTVDQDGVNTSSTNETEKMNFELYPNPSLNGEVWINYQGISETLLIYGVDGSLVSTLTITPNSPFQLSLAKGCYFLRIGDLTQKLLILE